jgi:phosphoserine phosphatase
VNLSLFDLDGTLIETDSDHAFGVDTLIAVELARDDNGHITGAVRGVPSLREGKVVRVERWLAGLGRRHADFDRVTVYSDSISDLPLLEWTTQPVATNPGPALAVIARERGWPVMNLFIDRPELEP